MNLDDFEQKQKNATTTTLNAETVMRLIDTMMSLPCRPDELTKVTEVRSKWFYMRSQGEDWSTWTTKDLECLLIAIVSMREVCEDCAGVLSVYLVARKLQGK